VKWHFTQCVCNNAPAVTTASAKADDDDNVRGPNNISINFFFHWELLLSLWDHYPRRFQLRSAKWQKAYIGPYFAVRIIEPVNCVLQKTAKSKAFVVHVDKLKRCYGETPTSWVSGSNQWIKSKFFFERNRTKNFQYSGLLAWNVTNFFFLSVFFCFSTERESIIQFLAILSFVAEQRCRMDQHCRICGKFVKSNNMSHHVRRWHSETSESDNTITSNRTPCSGRKAPTRPNAKHQSRRASFSESTPVLSPSADYIKDVVSVCSVVWRPLMSPHCQPTWSLISQKSHRHGGCPS